VADGGQEVEVLIAWEREASGEANKASKLASE
jgi:hypothetical protein